MYDYYNEHRKYVRVSFNQDVKGILEDNTKLDLSVINISLGGMGLVSKKFLNADDILTISITIDNDKFDLVCKIIFCKAVNNAFRIGVYYLSVDKYFIKKLKIIVTRLSWCGLVDETNQYD